MLKRNSKIENSGVKMTEEEINRPHLFLDLHP